MKSPSYILKNNYHEREQLRGLEKHVKRLEEISYQPPQISAMQKTIDISKQLGVRHKNQQISTKFIEQEVQRVHISQTVLQRSRENDSLIEKILSRQKKKLYGSTMHSQSQKSLIQQSKRKEEHRIVMENFNLAKRMIGLPPVISMKKFDLEFDKHKTDLNLLKRYHSIKGPIQQTGKLTNLVHKLNSMTKHTFSKSKSASNLAYISKILQDQIFLFLIQVKSIKLVNTVNPNPKAPYQYFWEVVQRNKVIGVTQSCDLEQLHNQLIDFLSNDQINVTLVLNKVKNHDSVIYKHLQKISIGQIDIDLSQIEFKDMEETYDMILKNSVTIEIPIIRVIEQSSATVGEIKFKIVTVLKRRRIQTLSSYQLDNQSKEENLQTC